MRAHRSVLLATAVVALLVAGTTTAALGVLDAQTTAGVRAAFGAASGDAAEVTVTVQVTEDPSAQDAAVRSVLGGLVGGVDITRSELPHSPADPLRAVWTVTPAASVRSTDVAGIAGLYAAAPAAFQGIPAVGTTGVDVEGDLSDTAAPIEAAVVAAAGVAPIALLLVLVIGVVAIVEPLRLLIRVRRPETVLLRSRGAAAPMLAGAGAIELGLLAIPTAAIGAAAGALGVGLWIGTAVNVWTAVAAGGLTALLTVGIGTALAGQDARSALTRGSANDSGRAGQVVALSVTALLVAGAAFTVWRFALHDPASGADPIGFLAIPVTLLAVAAIALVAFGPIAGIFSASAGAARGLPRALGARQLARRAGVYATMILILGLAAGGLVVAAGYGATAAAATAQQREIQVGADLRVGLPAGGSLSPATAESLPGVTSATPLLAADISYGGALGSLVVSGARADLDAPVLAGDAVRLEMTASPADAMPYGGTLRLVSLDTGESRDLELQSDATGLTGMLPPGRWAVIEVELQLGQLHSPEAEAYLQQLFASGFGCGSGCSISTDEVAPVDFSVTLTGFAVGGAVVTPGTGWGLAVAQQQEGYPGWTAAEDDGTEPVITGSASPFAGGATFDLVRREQPSPADITVTRALAERTGLAVGDPISLPFAHTGSRVDGTVAAIVDSIPGMSSARAAAVDLAAFEAQQIGAGLDPLPVTEIWIDSDDPAATAAALRERYGSQLPIQVAGTRIVDTIAAAARNALWTAALGALALAIVAVIGVAGALVAARRGEGVILRALGMTAGSQGAVVAGEFAAPVGFALLIGVIGGGLITWFLVPTIAAAAVPDGITGFSPGLSVDWLPLGAAIAVAVIGLGLVIWGAGAGVRRAAAQAVGGELR